MGWRDAELAYAGYVPPARSAEAFEPVGEERLFAGLVHSRDGEMKLLPGREANSIFIDGADLGESDLHAAMRVFKTIELEPGTAENELTGTAAAKDLVVTSVIGQRRIGRTG